VRELNYIVLGGPGFCAPCLDDELDCNPLTQLEQKYGDYIREKIAADVRMEQGEFKQRRQRG